MSRPAILLISAVLTLFGTATAQDRGPRPVPRPHQCGSVVEACFQTNQGLHEQITNLTVKLAQSEHILPPLGSRDRPASSCLAIRRSHPDVTSGVFYLQTGATVSRVFCHMQGLGRCGGEAWTTLMKVDGRKTTFTYDSELWTNTETYNEAGGLTGFDEQETKLKTFATMPFGQLCLVFSDFARHRPVGFLRIDRITASSLQARMAGSEFTSTAYLGRRPWLSSLPGSTLQNHCNVQGLNAVNTNVRHHKVVARARIGILGNNENECASPDSAIGVGTSGRGCGCAECDKQSAGSYHGCSPRKLVPAFVHVLAQ